MPGFWQGATKEHSRQGSVTEEQRSQKPGMAQPEGLQIFGAVAAWFVGRRSLKDILLPHALHQRQISSNAPVPYLADGF